MDPIRVGVIGAGANTRAKHIPLLREIDGVTIQMVSNRSPESSRAAADELKIPQIADSWQELVASPEIDAVVIGTWPYTHAEMTIAALANGKHVLCEARMAMNATEAMMMVEAAQAAEKQQDAAGRPLIAQIVPSPLTLRYDQTILRLVESGYLGDILAIDVRGSTGAFVDFEGPLHWRMERELSGNNIMMMGIFYEALVRWVGEASSVSAMGQVNVKHRSGREVTIPDHLDILVKMRCGAQARLQFSSVTGLAHSPMEFWLYGSQGTIHLDLSAGVLRAGKRGGSLEAVELREEEIQSWRVEEEFINAIRGTEKVRLTDTVTALKYMVFTDAVAKSLETERVVRLYPEIQGKAKSCVGCQLNETATETRLLRNSSQGGAGGGSEDGEAAPPSPPSS